MGEPTLPSETEFKLMRELWRHGDLTVRELHERLADSWPVGYTTVLKLLQRMTAKGLVTRCREGRSHRYSAAVREEPLERRLAHEFLHRTFGGSVERLLQRILPRDPTSSEELEQVRRLVDELDR